MFRISERTHAGLILMSALAERHASGAYVTLRDVAQRMGLSEGYLEEIAAALRTGGLVKGRTGPKGGYALARRPEAITAEDIVSAIEGPIRLVDCQFMGAQCPVIGQCASKRVWMELQQRIQASLRETTLAQLTV